MSPISLWQEVISGDGEAVDRTELGILQSVLFELLAFVFLCTARPSSHYHTLIFHPSVGTEHRLFSIINDTLYLFCLIRSCLFIHYLIIIEWVPSRC